MRNITSFYIDESGNTGDLTATNLASYFKEQRIFSLAAVGFAIDENFSEEFTRLKRDHRIQSQELKSRQAYEKPKMIIDLLHLLQAQSSPIFIEAVDKHYFVVANIVDRLLVPYIGEIDITPAALTMKYMIADYMALYAPPTIAKDFVRCCQTRNRNTIQNLYEAIIAWSQSGRHRSPEIAQGIERLASDALADFLSLSDHEAILPIPDKSHTGKLYWILPNLTSFTNIYARINKFSKQRLENTTIFHDEQVQFGKILQRNKTILETPHNILNSMPIRTANYTFPEASKLQFLRSHDSIGIQIADVLAGFIARYVQDVVWSGESPSHEKMAVFRHLITTGDPQRGTGINFVAPEQLVGFLGVEPHRNF